VGTFTKISYSLQQRSLFPPRADQGGDYVRHVFQFQPEDIKKALESAQGVIPQTGMSLNTWLKEFQPDPLSPSKSLDEVMLGVYAMATDFMEQMEGSPTKEEKISNLVLSFLHFMNVGITMVDGEFSGGNLQGN
jgi:hypothetical protein